MKKLLAALLAGVMLIASMPMAMAAPPTNFANLKAFAEYLNSQNIPIGIAPVEAPVEIKVKRANEAEQDHLSYTRTGSKETVDFVADLDLETVFNAYENYIELAKTAINAYGGDSKQALLEELEQTKVKGQFTVTITAPNNVTLPENNLNSIVLPALDNTTDVYFTGGAYDELFEENVQARTKNGNIITLTADVNGKTEAGWATKGELAEGLVKDLKLICNGIKMPDVVGTYEFKGVFTGWTDIYSGTDKLTTISYHSADETPDSNSVYYADIATITITEPSSQGGSPSSGVKGYLEITNTVIAPDGAIDDDYMLTYDIYRVVDGALTKVRSITLRPGETERVAVEPGTYYIYQYDENLEGLMLEVDCDDADQMVNVEAAGTGKIDFENIYTSKSFILEKEDHFAYIIGYPDGFVRPEANITRAEVATIFFRMLTDEAREQYYANTNTFSDVSNKSWYNIAISTLQQIKTINGYSDGTFRPNAPITRAELCKMAASFYMMKESDSISFSDISGHWAEKFIESAYEYGFISGYPDGTFKPNQLITRAEAMRIVNRALDRIANKDKLYEGMREWPDNMNKNAWYYADVQEATNSHYYSRDNGSEIWTGLRPNRNWAELEVVEK